MISLEHIRTVCSGEIRINERLAGKTSFRIGGPVDLYIEPLSAAELAGLVQYFREREQPFVVLGNGSNLLVADEGYRGATISLERAFGEPALEGGVVIAGAGMRMSQFVDFCITNDFGGVEMLAGIPGTLGGGVIMNAGAYGGEISDFIVDVTVLREDKVLTLSKEQCGFRYRGSGLRGDIVLSARFRLPAGDIEKLRVQRRELLIKRNAAQPVQYPNAGSIFKNPEGAFAAVLIQECGLKGFRHGGAVVSEKHANFIINTGDATAVDVLTVIRHVRETVLREKHVSLELEIQLLGFTDDLLAEYGIRDTAVEMEGS